MAKLNQIHRLTLSWSVSRGRDTEGYNIARLDDSISGKRYRTCGGGYDMIGTVLADWFKGQHQEALQALWKANEQFAKPYGCTKWQSLESFYGMTFNPATGNVSLDGGCGVRSILSIIEACGFEVEQSHNKKGHTIGFYVQAI